MSQGEDRRRDLGFAPKPLIVARMDFANEGPILVTGAGGFVGSAVARKLIAAGGRVRLIVRASSPRGNLDLANSEIVLGDLRDRGAVRAAMRGVRALFHVAADYRIWAPDPREIVRNNLEMTRCVMEAAQEAGVARDRLHQQRRDAAGVCRRPVRRRKRGPHRDDRDRRLQAQQGRRRTAG